MKQKLNADGAVNLSYLESVRDQHDLVTCALKQKHQDELDKKHEEVVAYAKQVAVSAKHCDAVEVLVFVIELMLFYRI